MKKNARRKTRPTASTKNQTQRAIDQAAPYRRADLRELVLTACALSPLRLNALRKWADALRWMDAGTAERPTPPDGLIAAFKMIQFDDATAIAARQDANRTYAHALNVIAYLTDEHKGQEHDDLLVQNELLAAVDTLYPSNNDPRSPGLASMAGFNVGFAVGWILLTSITGGAR